MGDGSDEQKLADLEAAHAEGADIIALGEHADRIDVTTEFCRRHPDFEQYFGDGTTGAAKECLLYRKSLGEVTLRKTIVLVKARKLPQGAGPENATNKCALRVRLRINGRRVNLIVGHQYASVGSRKEAAWLFMHALVDLVKARVGITIFFGDLNDVPKHALIKALRALFKFSSSDETGPTHKRRLIDYIMVRGRAKIIAAFTAKIHSDHRKVVVDVLI